jgi:Flp pilus assembly protein TadD
MSAPPSPSPDEYLEPGSVLDGRYRIDGFLGGGGMAHVYRAEHLGIGRWVAIKVLHAILSRSHEAVARFQREAVTSGRLEHPNIVSVTDSGALHDGRCFLVMEALDGETLAERLEREGRLPWRTALALMRGIVLGLQHAHEHGVVHRDIKPDNIFVLRRDQEPLVKILDFGIAKLQAHSTAGARITQQGLTIGSPTYMSPEQAADGEITPASDLYSATVVLFEMLTGHPPFDDRDPVVTMKAHVTMRPPTLGERAPEIDLPVGLEEIIQQGLAKIVAERIGSAGKLLGMLDRIRVDASAITVRGSRTASAPLEAPPVHHTAPGPIAHAEPSDPGIRRDGRWVERTALVRTRRRTGRRGWIALGSMAATSIAVAVVYLVVRSTSADQGTAKPGPGTNAIASVAVDAAPTERAAEPAAASDAGVEEADLAIAPEDVEPEIEMEDERGAAAAPPRPGAPRKRPRDPSRQWIKDGNAALKAGQFDEASTSFQRALAANRNAHAALAGLAEIAYNRASFSDAVLHAKRAVALAPARVAYRMTLAKAYYKLMRYDDAIQQWRKVLELEPSNASAKTNIEMALSKTGR